MASLYITEYKRLGRDSLENGNVAPEEVPVAEQKLTFTGTAAASNAFHKETSVIRIHTDAICSLVFGSTPVADATNQRLIAGQTQFHAVKPGSDLKVSAITNS